MDAVARKRALMLVFLTITIDLIGFGMIVPLLSLYAKHFGANGRQIGFLMAAYSLMQFICAPLWGRLSDVVGRRPVLLVSIAGNVLSLTVLALADSYGWILASRLISGMCTANISVANAYVADITPEKDRARGMGIVGAAFGLGFVLGPLIGAQASTLGYSGPGAVAALLAVCNLIGAFLWLPETRTAENRERSTVTSLRARLDILRRGGRARPLVMLLFSAVFAFSMLEMAFVLFAYQRVGFDVRECGWVFGYMGLIMVLLQGGFTRVLTRRFGEHVILKTGLLATALGMVLIPWTPAGDWHVMVLFVTLFAVGQGLQGPALNSLISRSADNQNQGMVMGTAQSLSALARCLGPMVAGFLFDMGNENWPLWLGGGLMVLAWLASPWALQGAPQPMMVREQHVDAPSV